MLVGFVNIIMLCKQEQNSDGGKKEKESIGGNVFVRCTKYELQYNVTWMLISFHFAIFIRIRNVSTSRRWKITTE